MKNVNESFKGLRIESGYDSAPAAYETYGRSRLVTGGSVVQGNFVSPNNFSYTVKEINFIRGTSKQTWGPTLARRFERWKEYKGCLAFGPDTPLFTGCTFPSDLYNDALSKLNEKTRGTLDLSIALFEAGQTARMLNVIRSVQNYTSGAGWRRLISGSAKARLEYQYGWRPLASDLYGAMDESLNFVKNQYEQFRVRSHRPVETSKDVWTTKGYGSTPGVVKRNGRYLCEISVKLKTKNFEISRWASLNPVSWAYELTPYSFVLDWIIDVGGFIRNFETSILYANSFVSGYVTKCTAFDATFSCNASREDGAWNSYMMSTIEAEGSGRLIDFSRSVLSRYPVPRMPSFKADLGANRLLNLAALLGSKLK